MNPVEIIQVEALKRHEQHSSQWEVGSEARILDAYRALSPAQARELALYLLGLWDTSRSKYEGVVREHLKDVAVFAPECLRGLHRQMIERGIFYPAEMYLGADHQTRDQLIALIEGSAGQKRDLYHLVECLVWIGDEVVQSKLDAWRRKPPIWWGENAYLPIEECAKESGWELTSDGKRRNLYYPVWQKLLPVETPAGSGEHAPVVAGVYSEEQCQWCGRLLVYILDLDLSDSRLAFLELPGERLCIPFCVWCCMTGTLHFDIDFNGVAHWSQVNGPKPYGFITAPKIGLQVKEQRYLPGPLQTNPHEPALNYVEYYIWRFGGLPRWVQSPEYPLCPGCGQSMRLLAHVEPGRIDSLLDEGTLYIFLCAHCGKAATVYQQT